MPLWRSVGVTAALSLMNLNVTTCRSNADDASAPPAASAPAAVKLDGVDTSALTAREQGAWSEAVSELLAPCPDQPVSLAQCVKEGRACATCKPAARFLATHVKRGRTRSQIEDAFRLRFASDTVKQVPVGDSPAKGAKDASVVIVEWADFQCPFCRAAVGLIDGIVERYPGQVQVVFKHFPLGVHEHAELAARAAVAAGRQGKFWEMHAALFEHQEALGRKPIERIAADLGLDAKRFGEDLDSEPVADAVAADRKLGEKFGLTGTPMIYINGRHFELEHFSPFEDLDEWVRLEIELVTGKTAPKAAQPAAAPSAAPASGAAPPPSTPAPSASAPRAGSAQPAPSAQTP